MEKKENRSRALVPLRNKWAFLHYRRTKEIIQQLDRVMHAFTPSTLEAGGGSL